VCEIDAEGAAWPILQDANYNAVAMADDAGAVVAQRVLSPYGRVLISDPPAGAATPPLSRIGHQGLFAERLDGDTLDDPLAAGGTLAWHNRNRTLLSSLGRFAQRDPNATGQGASDALAMHGGAAPMDKLRTDPAMLFANGLNIYGYAGASPSQHRDPSGLFIDFFMPGPSDFVTDALASMTNAYAANLMWDVEWALDWDLPDEMHTRNNNDWVHLALAQGLYNSFEIGIPFTDIGVNPLDALSRVYYKDERVGGRTRTHGARLTHYIHMVKEFAKWRTIPGVTGLKLNKALRGKDGNILRGANGETLRPDLQFWYRGKLRVFEFWTRRADRNKKSQYIDILKHNGVPKNTLKYEDREGLGG